MKCRGGDSRITPQLGRREFPGGFGGPFPPHLIGGSYGQFFRRAGKLRFFPPPFARGKLWPIFLEGTVSTIPALLGGASLVLEHTEVNGEDRRYVDGQELINVHTVMGSCDSL